MTDIEKFVSLYKSIGIDILPIHHYKSLPNEVTIQLEVGGCDRFIGYSGFHTEIAFDLDGKFLTQGMWE